MTLWLGGADALFDAIDRELRKAGGPITAQRRETPTGARAAIGTIAPIASGHCHAIEAAFLPVTQRAIEGFEWAADELCPLDHRVQPFFHEVEPAHWGQGNLGGTGGLDDVHGLGPGRLEGVEGGTLVARRQHRALDIVDRQIGDAGGQVTAGLGQLGVSLFLGGLFAGPAAARARDAAEAPAAVDVRQTGAAIARLAAARADPKHAAQLVVVAIAPERLVPR